MKKRSLPRRRVQSSRVVTVDKCQYCISVILVVEVLAPKSQIVFIKQVMFR